MHLQCGAREGLCAVFLVVGINLTFRDAGVLQHRQLDDVPECFFQAEDGIRDTSVTGVQTCALPIFKEPMDLRGKKVGVTRIGGSADLALDYALKKWGLQRGRDVIVVQTGGLPESLAALRSGVVNGAVLSPPNNLLAKKAGLREMVDIGQLGIIFPNTALSTTRSYLKSNREGVIRLFR